MTVSFHKYGDLFFPGTGDVKVLPPLLLHIFFLFLRKIYISFSWSMLLNKYFTLSYNLMDFPPYVIIKF